MNDVMTDNTAVIYSIPFFTNGQGVSFVKSRRSPSFPGFFSFRPKTA